MDKAKARYRSEDNVHAANQADHCEKNQKYSINHHRHVPEKFEN